MGYSRDASLDFEKREARRALLAKMRQVPLLPSFTAQGINSRVPSPSISLLLLSSNNKHNLAYAPRVAELYHFTSIARHKLIVSCPVHLFAPVCLFCYENAEIFLRLLRCLPHARLDVR